MELGIIRQVAALPYRITRGRRSGLQVLLVTSCSTRRWIIPKGNIQPGLAPYQAAAVEAEEEAGVRGAISPTPIGRFNYRKKVGREDYLLAEVEVFPLVVEEVLRNWPEKSIRIRRWLSRSVAAEAVEEPELAVILRSFSP